MAGPINRFSAASRPGLRRRPTVRSSSSPAHEGKHASQEDERSRVQAEPTNMAETQNPSEGYSGDGERHRWQNAAAPMLSFPPFRLDLRDERLWKDDKVLSLRRKPFAILKHLVERPQRLVTHNELVEAVWGKVVISESLLRTHVRDLRQ